MRKVVVHFLLSMISSWENCGLPLGCHSCLMSICGWLLHVCMVVCLFQGQCPL